MIAIRTKILELLAGIRGGSLVLCVGLILALPAYADGPTFGELLAQAKAQAAAGHRWSPPGDNMTETVMKMMDIVPTATHDQLAELSALLESDKSTPPSETGGLGAPPNRQATRDAAPTSDTPSSTVPSPIVPSPLAPPDGVQPTSPAPKAMSPPTGPDRPRPAISGVVAPQPSARSAALFARGQDAERLGDFSGARRFYASAAQLGEAAAARNLGRLYDPAYLRQTALGGVDPDPDQARYWYQRAVQLGDTQAGPLLEALSVR